VNADGHATIPDKLVSPLLADDPDVLDLVIQFVEGLSQRADEFRQAFEQLDWDRLVRIAHQLKGAGGSYGYRDLSRLAREAEDAFRAHSAEHFAEWMVQFEQVIAAARAGLPQA
jgi:HPt (histidine-containing phosphotransfer) domain-containing protein